jgi:hypothetical protein
MAATSKRTVKRVSLARAQRRRKECLELVQRYWPFLSLREARDLRLDDLLDLDAVATGRLNVP